MESVFKQRRSTSRVTPSGVPCEIYSLKGVDQADITINEDAKRKKAINKMLLRALKSLGNKDSSSLTLKDVERLLEEDRKYLLWELRMFSNETGGNLFIFDYEFPVKDQQKRRSRYTVEFNREQFPFRPYKWVGEKMIADYKEANQVQGEINDEERLICFQNTNYPVMYDSYEDMLTTNLQQEMVLPVSKVKVFWRMLTEERREELAKKIPLNQVSSHTPIWLRDPRYLPPEVADKVTEKGLDKLIIPVPLDDLDIPDIEALRLMIFDMEAKIETTLVVQYKEQFDSQTLVDLTNTATFFFPSSAIA